MLWTLPSVNLAHSTAFARASEVSSLLVNELSVGALVVFPVSTELSNMFSCAWKAFYFSIVELPRGSLATGTERSVSKFAPAGWPTMNSESWAVKVQPTRSTFFPVSLADPYPVDSFETFIIMKELAPVPFSGSNVMRTPFTVGYSDDHLKARNFQLVFLVCFVVSLTVAGVFLLRECSFLDLIR